MRSNPVTAASGASRSPRAPSLLDAVLLIGLIALTIWLFGVSATDDPLQVALLLSAAFPSLMALENGFTSAAIADAVDRRCDDGDECDLHPAGGRGVDRNRRCRSDAEEYVPGRTMKGSAPR